MLIGMLPAKVPLLASLADVANRAYIQGLVHKYHLERLVAGLQ
jgi:hypothetical protein